MLNRGSASWLWAHGTTGAPVPAMSLDSSHNLLLYQVNGTTAGITLTPASNQISLGTATLTATGTALAANGALTVGGGIANNTGSFTSPTALSFSAGGTNQNITLTPSGTGYTILNGNVGIGTNTPTSGLDVRTAYPQLTLGDQSGSKAGALRLRRGGDGQLMGKVGWLNATDGNTFEVGIINGGATNVNLTAGVASNSYITFTQNATERMRIDSSGNVGIGTTSPATTLDVRGIFSIDSSVNGAVMAQLGRSSTDSGFLNLFTGGVSTTVIATNQPSYFNGGNVGIGTTIPTSKLHVDSPGAGDENFITLNQRNGYLSGGRNFIRFTQGTTPALNARFGFDYDSYGLQFRNSSDSPTVTIKDNGNVGIGTASPGALLEVSKASTDATVKQEVVRVTTTGRSAGGGTPDRSALISFFDSANATYTGALGGYRINSNNDYNGGLQFYVNNTGASPNQSITSLGEAMRITNLGNVGIGTTTPQSYAALDVNTTGQKSIHTMDSVNGGLIIGFNGPTIQARTTSDGNTANLILQGWGGNVGIGTIDPGAYKLAVKGSIHAQEVVVDNTNWADYVFDSNYRLAPLSEVEQHIKSEKHLPGIPSAQEIAEHGVSMGDMQSKLLSKIEELTLHMIAQEKQMIAQQKAHEEEIAGLKAQNANFQQQLGELRSVSDPKL